MLAILALFVQGAPQIDETQASAVSPSAYQVEVVAEGLNDPWDLSWLPSGDILVTERPGQLRVIRDGALLPTPVSGVPEVFAASQAGLFEAVPHPDFEDNGYLYLTYAAGTQGANTLTLARGVFEETREGGRLSNIEILFTARAERDTAAHYGGRMVWLEDGTLLLTSGEGYAYKAEAPKLDNHFGKILRLTEDGDPAPGNPFLNDSDALPEIWSHGHRNPQGIAVTPAGTVYSNEHGPRGGDEMNRITPGTDYGWPVITYGIDYSGAQISPYTELPGREQPLFHWTPSIAPSALLYYDADDFPQWQGKLLSSALAYKQIQIADPGNPDAPQTFILRERDMRIRDVALSPDGTLFATTEIRGDEAGGEVLRIVPAD